MTIKQYVKAGLFKVEYHDADTTCVHLFSTKRSARKARNVFGGTIRRGPEHNRGETGETRHAWIEANRRWEMISSTITNEQLDMLDAGLEWALENTP